MLAGLCNEHNFTVFAPQFDNPRPDRITHVPVPVPLRPLVLLFATFHLALPLTKLIFHLKNHSRFDIEQSVESNSSIGSIIYSHFCHTAYLERQAAESRVKGVKGYLRWLDHKLHSLLEKSAYRRAQRVVVPSQGLASELLDFFPNLQGKIFVIPNATDVEDLVMPGSFDQSAFRRTLGFSNDDFVLSFVALGHFERKGLPLLIDAIKSFPQHKKLKLMVIGGTPQLVSSYLRTIQEAGIKDRIIFTGPQKDVKLYLWASNAFAFPSEYETFSLVTFEAAAAGLPIIVSDLYGVQDFVEDGRNAILVERNVDSVRKGIERLLVMTPEQRSALGSAARESVQGYSPARFVEAWRHFYSGLEKKQLLTNEAIRT
jgi:glycosyltransferase involved in cell wall biosynthesis